ncbi:hypothetical protein MBRA_06350 [Methylobacterium brachiatum]|nr:hypothetical protein MBRA_06350 [Methylobacterium brachiatum]
MFGRLRKPVTGRSSTVTSPSLRASRIALRTVVSATPTIAARCPTVSRQSFRRTTSAATRARTACSASVNRAASPGGSRPDAAQRRRRSIEASVRGREPTVLLDDPALSWMGALSWMVRSRLGLVSPAAASRRAAGAPVRASISPDNVSASASVTFPSPNARHSSAVTDGRVIRSAASIARRISSANTCLGPFHRATGGRSAAQAVRSVQDKPVSLPEPGFRLDARGRFVACEGCKPVSQTISIFDGLLVWRRGARWLFRVLLRRSVLLVTPATRTGCAPAGHGMSAGRHG